MLARQYTLGVRFCPWYPLADAEVITPAAPGVLQLRRASGLLDYPSGKSAMVWYGHAEDMRAIALDLSRAHTSQDLLCRHLIEIDDATDLPAFCAKLRGEFVRRFGSVPILELAEPTRS